MATLTKEHSESHFYILLGLVVTISLLEICGQAFIRKYRQDGRTHFIIFGIFMYLTVIALLFHSYKFHGMAIVNLLWSCLSIIMAIVVGHIVFKETFNHYMTIAVVLAFVAIVFANKAQSIGK
jgi:multidrug transporter EmrE-like cation transporter